MKELIPLVLAAVVGASALAAEGDLSPHSQINLPAPMERHGPGPNFGRGVVPMLHGVALTEAQEDKLFALMHALEPQRRHQQREARKASESLQAMAASGQFDDTKASALAQSEGRAVAALALLRARTEAKILALLTPEQRREAQQDGLQRMPERGPRR